MKSFTIEEKYKILLNVLNTYQNIQYSLQDSCKQNGITAYHFHRWMQDKRLEPIRNKYLAVVHIRAEQRKQHKIELADRIIHENLEGYEIETTQTIAKLAPDGKPIPVMVKKIKKEIGPNINAAIQLLHLYDKPIMLKQEPEKNIELPKPNIPQVYVVQNETPPPPEPEVVNLPPVFEILEMPEDYEPFASVKNKQKEKELKEKEEKIKKQLEMEKEDNKPSEKPRYIKIDEDIIIEI
jgi:hypothetical protein